MLLDVGETLERLYRMSLHDLEKFCKEHNMDFDNARYLRVTLRVQGEIFSNDDSA